MTRAPAIPRNWWAGWPEADSWLGLESDRVDRPLLRIHHARILRRALGTAPIGGNHAEVLVDGPQTHAAMFKAIEAARDHINIESYIVEDDGPGVQLRELLVAKCREGVRVNLIYDAFGCRGTRSTYFEALQRAGVRLAKFNPLEPWRHLSSAGARLIDRLQRRDHRKLLVVDGRVAFIGGVNISSVYSRPPGGQSPADDPMARWRDTHLRVTGPIVASLQRLYLDHWRAVTRAPTQPAEYFPAVGEAGAQRMLLVASDAGRRRNPLYRALIGAIDGARYSVHLTSAYFVPTRRLARALARAARRGVDVRLALPGVSDAWAALAAGRATYGPLLRAGVRVYERHNTMLHAKTAVVDGLWATVGSSNMDWRSLIHNAEANLVVLDRAVALELEALFRHDIADSEEVTLERWSARNWTARCGEWLARRVEFFL